jgi:hypothetical protein
VAQAPCSGPKSWRFSRTSATHRSPCSYTPIKKKLAEDHPLTMDTLYWSIVLLLSFCVILRLQIQLLGEFILGCWRRVSPTVSQRLEAAVTAAWANNRRRAGILHWIHPDSTVRVGQVGRLQTSRILFALASLPPRIPSKTTSPSPPSTPSLTYSPSPPSSPFVPPTPPTPPTPTRDQDVVLRNGQATAQLG